MGITLPKDPSVSPRLSLTRIPLSLSPPLLETTSYLPPEVWDSVVLFTFLALIFSAWEDARHGRFAEAPLGMGLMLVVGVFGFWGGWDWSAGRLTEGLTALVLLMGIKEVYRRLTGVEGFGALDALWTAFAVTTFGFLPVASAWIMGAWGAIAWIGVCAVRHHFSRSPVRVAFRDSVPLTPFLGGGLGVSLALRLV